MSNSELVTLCCLYSFWRQKVTQEPLPSKKCLQDLLSSGIVTQVPTKSSRHPPSPLDLCCHLLCCTGNEPEQMNPSEPLEFFHQEQVFCSGLVLCRSQNGSYKGLTSAEFRTVQAVGAQGCMCEVMGPSG